MLEIWIFAGYHDFSNKTSPTLILLVNTHTLYYISPLSLSLSPSYQIWSHMCESNTLAWHSRVSLSVSISTLITLIFIIPLSTASRKRKVIFYFLKSSSFEMSKFALFDKISDELFSLWSSTIVACKSKSSFIREWIKR